MTDPVINVVVDGNVDKSGQKIITRYNMKQMKSSTLTIVIFLAGLSFLGGCQKNRSRTLTGLDSTKLAIANNKYYRITQMSDSELITVARNSDEPVHSFTKREQFVSYQKHSLDSLIEHLGNIDNR